MSQKIASATEAHAVIPAVQASDNVLDKFKKLVRKAIFLKPEEEPYFKAIPDEKWRRIFEVNFNGNFAYADRVVLKKFRDIKKIDMPRVAAEQMKIHNLEKAAKMLLGSIDAGEPVVFITDIDNDGSFSQSIIQEFLKADPSAGKNTFVEYTQTVNGEKLVNMRGIDSDKPFLLVTADNGINSLKEQEKIQARYPTAKILITDHHKPEGGMTIEEGDQTVIFNPHYETKGFFEKFNISGAATVGVLLRRALEKRLSAPQLEAVKVQLENITTLSRVANLLDYVHSDPMDKPEKDYVVTKFLQLQGLMNINNSLSRIILDGIPQKVRDELKKHIPNLDDNLLETEARNIEAKNYTARILLRLHEEARSNPTLKAEEFGAKLVQAMAKPENYEGMENEVNRNFIEQLRPPIFSLSVDEQKTPFMEKLCDAMVETYESIRESEKKLAGELRKGQAMQRARLEYSSIGYADPGILSTFNRKFLGKVYNDENPGFLAILDSAGRARSSGSFRSMYDISDILPPSEKTQLEFELGVRIQTPGHERAAGFIIESANPELDPITPEKINAINRFMNDRVKALKSVDATQTEQHLLTDMSAIGLIDRINRVVRGSISNFERIVPLLKITEDTIWTDSYSTRQYSMKDIADEKRFGYVSINTDFHKGTVIVPVELIRRIVENDYQDYLAVNYMDGGVFMAERVVEPKSAPNIADLRGVNHKAKLIDDVFTDHFTGKNVVFLSRAEIKDNPFFKYNNFGKSDFNLFERMVIGLIDTQRVEGRPIDTLAVFDVEANGFGNGKLMNFGAMNYSIAPGVQKTADVDDFQARLFQNQRGREFLLTPEQIEALVPVAAEDKPSLPLAQRQMLLMKRFATPGNALSYDVYYDYPDSARNDVKTPGLGPIAYVNNHAEIDGKVVYNREIKAEMLAFLITDDDFKVPQEMTNLTGITQEHLNKHGKPTKLVDKEISDYYKGKTVLFGAHNTPYDARIMRANTPKTYKTLRSNGIYDSALFCKEDKLAYDDVKVSSFYGIKGIPQDVHFYDNAHSDFSLTDFIANDHKDGYYPDRTGQYLLSRENGEYYFIDKKKHETVKVSFMDFDEEGNALPEQTDAQTQLIVAKREESIPNISIKYSVEKLSEQWMTHALLLSEEKFDIKHVDLSQPQYESLVPFKNQLIFFQDNYLFDSSPDANINHIRAAAFAGGQAAPEREVMEEFVAEFLKKNHDIQKKFTDSWMYKSVLSIMDPKSQQEISNDNVKLVHFQTQIPETKIREIFSQALRFKEHYKIDHVLQHEGHVNGPWKGDHKGDVAFEDKLTLTMLARRMYNPYSRDITSALNRFAEASKKAKLAFDLAHSLSDGAAHDSYSYRQGLLYKRDESSPMIKGIQAKEGRLADEHAVHVIKLKLDNDVLPDEVSVNAIVRSGVSISRADIIRDAEMLDFILVNEQTRSSMKNAGAGATELTMLMESNDKISLEHKRDLAKRYRYVEISKRDLQLKSLLKKCLEVASGGASKVKFKTSTVCDLGAADLDIIESILKNQVGLGRPGEFQKDQVDEAHKLLDLIRSEREPSALEKALANQVDLTFKAFSEVRDPNFLPSVEINRRDPIHTLLFKHPHLRMGNAFLQEQIREHGLAPAQEEAQAAPKRGRRMGP
jgi:single-stranded DNA-specific DHH superfamily exonuclease